MVALGILVLVAIAFLPSKQMGSVRVRHIPRRAGAMSSSDVALGVNTSSHVEVPSEGGWVVIPAVEFDSPPHPGVVVSIGQHARLSTW